MKGLNELIVHSAVQWMVEWDYFFLHDSLRTLISFHFILFHLKFIDSFIRSFFLSIILLSKSVCLPASLQFLNREHKYQRLSVSQLINEPVSQPANHVTDWRMFRSPSSKMEEFKIRVFERIASLLSLLRFCAYSLFLYLSLPYFLTFLYLLK